MTPALRRGLRTFVLVGLAFLFGYALGATASEAPVPRSIRENSRSVGPLGRARISFRESRVNLGQVVQGRQVVRKLAFVNRGTELLRLGDITTSCHCTVAVPTLREIPPGRAGELEATFDSAGMRGQVRRSIYVHSNDSSMPMIQLELEAEVVPVDEPTFRSSS